MSGLTPGVPLPIDDAAAATSRIPAAAPLGDPALRRLRDVCERVVTDDIDEAGRDWWPLSLVWATQGVLPARPGAVARPTTPEQVAAVLQVCHEAQVPVTPAAGRSGVCGGTVPVHGGVLLDLRDLAGVRGVDDASLLVDVLPGTYGDALEDELRGTHGLTVGHWPQSVTISTVGGWLACRGAGQYSTRYGKIEDIVTGLDVALADGTLLRTGDQPRQATGPDLTQLFVGSEGTLGVIVGARLKAHPVPPAERRAAYGFPSFTAGLDAMRRILRRGATPAVLRLYDETESKRSYDLETNVLLVLDEGDPRLVDAVLHVVGEECGQAEPLDVALVERWLGHRNDVSALEALVGRGYVVDTMEVTGSWSALPAIYAEAVAAMLAVEGTAAASAHQSHSYADGGCLYFSVGGVVEPDRREEYYRAVWDAGTRAVLRRGGSLSHHHGVGLNRARFMAEALGPAFGTLAAVKRALDPHGVLNPGKLGLPSPFGEVPWP